MIRMMTYQDILEVNKGLKTIPIRNKAYVEVNTRVIAFRKLFPDGSITTSVEAFANDTILVKAEVRDGNGKLLASGLAFEDKASSTINKTSFVENAETSAVGRALGFLGIGIDTAIASYEEVSHAIEQQEAPLICEECGKEIKGNANWTAEQVADASLKTFGKKLCLACGQKEMKNKEETI